MNKEYTVDVAGTGGTGLAAADAAVSAVPAFVFVFLYYMGRLVVFLVEGQNVGGAVPYAHAAADAFIFVENRRHDSSPRG